MIQVRNVSKRYGRHQALDDISFEVKKGDILGFLGPNGAGKSTTMNIITGYISCDSGEVLIDGKNILEDPKAAKSRMGYLPEIPPLYNDMTVEKYLEFMFRLKRIRLPMEEHISKILDDLNLSDVSERIIGHLSKGYRQRVGLAQALLGDPELLILDEPTTGLDPNQLVEIRSLIKSLSKLPPSGGGTGWGCPSIILSTHIMQEVREMCDRVIILDHGTIKADLPIDEIPDLETLFHEKTSTTR